MTIPYDVGPDSHPSGRPFRDVFPVRRIDPDAEAERLGRERLDPPGREWGIRHPDGNVTVHITGQAFDSRIRAEMEREACDRDCDSCDGGPHTLVYRDKQPWRDA